MHSKEQMKALMANHPGVRPGVLGLVERIIDRYYEGIVEQLGAVAPQNSPVNLVMASIDDSGSMTLEANGELVQRGYNTLITGLQKSTAQHRTMVGTRLFNSGVVHSFVRLLDTPPLVLKPTQWGTPLFQSALVGMVVLLVKSAILLEQSSIRSSTTLLLVSDGFNEQTQDGFTADDVKALATSMRASQQIRHQFIGIGVSHPFAPDYNELFAAMGVPKEFIHTALKDAHSLRQLFGEVTTSIEQHGSSGGVGAEMMRPENGGGVVEVTEELGELPGYPGAHDGNTQDMPPGTPPWPQNSFGGWAS
jgi:hypothetical protein